MKTLKHLNAKTNNMQPFNLERFRAGEPAYYQKRDCDEHFYLADLPDDKIAVKYFDRYSDEWDIHAASIQYLNEDFYMKEKKLTWEEVYNMWWTDMSYHTNFYGWCRENLEAPKLKNQ
jgi:hypothetical protein